MKKSLRNMFKKKKQEPRQEKELITAYNQLATRVGLVTNQIKMFEKELDGLFTQMNSINNEANARQQLDAEAKKNAPPVTEVQQGAQ